MKKVYLVLTLILLNSTLFSCTDNGTAETDELYYEQAGGGDDGEVNDDPDN